MFSHVRQFGAVTALTALDGLRQPLCLLLTGACVLSTALTPQILLHQFGEDGRLARDGGLAFHFVFGLFLVGYTACTVLRREMRDGTAAATLCKPMGRTLFYLAKFAGIVLVVSAFSFCATLATLISERVAERFVHTETLFAIVTDTRTGRLLLLAPFVALLAAGALNYALRRPFESTAFFMLALSLLTVFLVMGFFDRRGQWAPYDWQVDPRIVPAGLLVALALTVLGAIALALSTRLNATFTLALLSAIFLLGLLSDHVFGAQAATSRVADGLYRVTPNWQHFWMADALGGDGTVGAGYLVRAARYGALYIAAFLCIGNASFYGVDVEARG